MMKKFIAVLLMVASVAVNVSAEVAYKDEHVRFTVIDETTLRLEYAPDGRFVENKSFVAVEREYAKVKCSVKESGGTVTITTPKLKLTYQKGNGPLSEKNLCIKAEKFGITWMPGMKQTGNLKGTYRTLDGYDGNRYVYDNGKPMPIEDGLIATDGWTLVDDSNGMLFDGNEDWDWAMERCSAEGAQDWYFMAYGHDYKTALKSFTRFAGRMALPPRYAFGYWWSRYWAYSEQDFRNLVKNLEDNDIPLDVLVIDMDWHPITPETGGGWTGWDWNENLFPDYRKFLSFLHEHGIKVTMNLHPADGVRPYEKKYSEFCRRAGRSEGDAHEWLGSDKQYVKAIFDTYLHPYMHDGVNFWWIDWQQWLNDKKINRLSNTWWCNYIFFSDMERMGAQRPMLYHRWGGLGNHRYQIGFSGDSYITWESLAFLPYFNSTASNVLYGYWSHDIGGHMSHKHGTPMPEELYIRAMQMGQYLPILRTHSTKDEALNKEPWAFGPKTLELLRSVIQGRYALVPYIYTMAREAYDTGVAICRPLYYDYPEAKEAYEYQTQYMFGDQMMIAPITQPVNKDDGLARLDIWLPEGKWMEYDTREMLDGGQTVERMFKIDEYPVYVKAGSIIPYYNNLRNLNGTEQAVTVRVFPGGAKGRFDLYEDNGDDCDYAHHYATTPLTYKRSGKKLTVKIGVRQGCYDGMPATREYRVVMPCESAPNSVKVNGKPMVVEYNSDCHEAIVELGAIDCAKGAVIVME